MDVNRSTVPGDIYLCQVDETKSCGACCGLYNLADLSRPALESLLNRRTLEFASVKREIAALDAFALRETGRLGGPQPFSGLHHCPFIGLIGPARRRVGCLLHPLSEGNDGVDYRGVSYYGGMACRDFFCASTHSLPSAIKELLRGLEVDWYAYGLIVTEAILHQALFDEIRQQSGDDPQWYLLLKETSLSGFRKALLTLKLTWPYRDPDKSLCHYLFNDGEHQRSAIDYARLKAAPSRFDTILRELDSRFESVQELKGAEALLSQTLNISFK